MHSKPNTQGIDIDSGQLAYFYADLGNMHAGMPLGFLLHALQYRGCNAQLKRFTLSANLYFALLGRTIPFSVHFWTRLRRPSLNFLGNIFAGISSMTARAGVGLPWGIASCRPDIQPGGAGDASGLSVSSCGPSLPFSQLPAPTCIYRPWAHLSVGANYWRGTSPSP